MTIVEATKTAMKENCGIKRSTSRIEYMLLPTTDSVVGYAVYILVKPYRRRTTGWVPNASDIIADDWVLVYPTEAELACDNDAD